MKVKCINNEGFSLITVNKIYEVVEETRDYYYIRNNSKTVKRYGKNRFEVVPEVVEAKEVAPKKAPVEKKPAKKMVVCKLPTDGLTFGQKYEVLETLDKHYRIKDDNKESSEFLIKRFEDVA